MASATTGQYSTNIQKLLSDIENYGKFSYTGQDSYKAALDKLLGHGDFTYDKQAQLDAAMEKVLSPESFTYDPATDPTWSSYKKIYSREGDRAAQNTLAQASVATGGVPSSYAVTAAQQAQNYYNGQMADALPTLRQNAYQEYLDNYDKQLTALSVLTGDRDTQYGAWQDAYSKLQSDLSALQADRDTQYGQWSDSLSILQNALGNYQNQDATDYQKQQDAYTNLLTMITTTGYVPDAATLAAAGMSADEAAAWKAYYDKANTPSYTYSSQPVTDDSVGVDLGALTGIILGAAGDIAAALPGAGNSYDSVTDAQWNSLFSSMTPAEVQQTVAWLVSEQGVSANVLQKYLNLYGPTAGGTSPNKGTANAANMLK